MALVKIDAPGAGDWIMSRVEGTFTPDMHSFSNHDEEGKILGGIVASGFFGRSMTAHMAGTGKRWFTRELAWLVFDYCFNQNACHKMFAGVRSDNHLALAIDLRGGWQLETVLKDVFEPGVDLMVLTMTRETCPWLDYQPKQFRSNVTTVVPGVIGNGR